MITNRQRLELISEFDELADTQIVLEKEVYAHFGLLLYCFSLVEHSLINTLSLQYVSDEFANQRIRTKEEWEQAYDKGSGQAKKKTFGNLVRSVSLIPEFLPFTDELAELKSHRDYFAHHFFREEAGIFCSHEGCWHLLWVIKQLRNQISVIEPRLTLALRHMSERLGVPLPSDEFRQHCTEAVLAEAQARLVTSNPFHWHKSAE